MRLDPVANMLTQGANYFSLPEFKFIIGFPDIFLFHISWNYFSRLWQFFGGVIFLVDGKSTTWALELDSETFFSGPKLVPTA